MLNRMLFFLVFFFAAVSMGDQAYNGIGLSLAVNDSNQFIIDLVFKTGPAHEARLKHGDILLAVDGTDLKNKALGEVAKMLRGPTGSSVTVQIQNSAGVRTAELVRATITLPDSFWGGSYWLHAGRVR